MVPYGYGSKPWYLWYSKSLTHPHMVGFPKWGPQNGWFTMAHPKMVLYPQMVGF